MKETKNDLKKKMSGLKPNEEDIFWLEMLVFPFLISVIALLVSIFK